MIEELKEYDYAEEYADGHLIAHPVLDKGGVRLVDHMGSDLSIVNAARASYAKRSTEMTPGNEKLVSFLAKGGHTSPARHAFVSFEFKAPIEVARQHWKYVVGSDHCQPTGTQVTVLSEDGEEIQKDIEDTRIGDIVLTYDINNKHIYRKGKRVSNKFNRYVEEYIYAVTAMNKTSRYTKEHPCVIKLGNAFVDGGYVVYLMKRGNSFRVGYTKTRRNDSLGLRVRFTREKPDAMWVLGVFDNEFEARMTELVTAYKYGIPMTLFRATENGANQHTLDIFWERMGDLSSNGKNVIGNHGLLIDEPLFSIDNFSKSIKTQTTIVTAACNLLPGMLVMTPTSDKKGYEKELWIEISDISMEKYSGNVYSLTIDDTHTYIADGILTHNCMDGWNEASGRYITKQDEFYLPFPDQWRSKPENSKQGSGPILPSDIGHQLTNQLMLTYEAGEKKYQWALEQGVAPEMARLFLPAYGLYTFYYWSASLQSVLHFLNQRLASDAQHEITDYAKVVYKMMETRFPVATREFVDVG